MLPRLRRALIFRHVPARYLFFRATTRIPKITVGPKKFYSTEQPKNDQKTIPELHQVSAKVWQELFPSSKIRSKISERQLTDFCWKSIQISFVINQKLRLPTKHHFLNLMPSLVKLPLNFIDPPDIVEQNSTRNFFRLIKTRVPDSFKVKFWMKEGKNDGDKDLKIVRSDYRFPVHFFNKDVPTTELEEEAVIYMNKLLEQAGSFNPKLVPTTFRSRSNFSAWSPWSRKTQSLWR